MKRSILLHPLVVDTYLVNPTLTMNKGLQTARNYITTTPKDDAK